MERDFLQKSQEQNYCKYCDYTTSNMYDFTKHNSTRKHLTHANSARLELIGTKKNVKKSQDHITSHYCNICNFTTTNKCNYTTHLQTNKHLSKISNSENPIEPKNQCTNCNKLFVNTSGLWKHKQKCQIPSLVNTESSHQQSHSNSFTDVIESVNNTVFNETMFIEFMKSNKELQSFLVEQNQKLMTELSKSNSVTNNSNNNTNNITNNQFNLNVFLNETCKDAMNITDFVNSLKVTIEEFENTGKLGYIEGISRIIINRLKGIDTTKRPVHCTDAKRETLYVRDEDAWSKDSDDNMKMKKAVAQVARMNLSQLPKWQKENPESEILDTKQHDQYVKYAMAALGGKGEEEEAKFIDKIMKNVLKEIIIDKETYKKI